jgi:PAS domain S-box-containing protein
MDAKHAEIDAPGLPGIVDKVIDHTSAMMGYWDTNLVCQFSNRAYSQWFGKSREQMRGITMAEALGSVFTLNAAQIRGVLAGEQQIFEREVTIPDGRVRYSLMTYTPDRVDGVVVGFFVHVADVTPLKMAEFDLRVAHAELLSTQLLLADSVRDSERMRIARDLHDAIGHHLTALNLHLELALRKTAKPVEESLQLSRRLAQDLLEETRRVVTLEREPQTLHMQDALQVLCDGIPMPAIHLHVGSSDQKLPAAWAYAIFRCVQEGITNAVRHSGATQMWVHLTHLDSHPRVVMYDNGRCQQPVREGNGLRGMRERVEAVAGDLCLERGPQGGMRVQIDLPHLN